MDADKPPENPTQKLPASDIQIGLLNKLVDAVSAMRTEVHSISDDLKAIDRRVTILEAVQDNLRLRADSNSMRAKQQSDADMTQDAELAKERAAREELTSKVASIESKTDAQTAILTRLEKLATGLAADPRVKWVVAALWTAVVAWLAKRGFGP